MNTASEVRGTVEVALKHAARLMESQPRLAGEQAEEILKAAPNHPAALLILAAARRVTGDNAGALAILEPLAQAQRNWPAAHYELGLALGAAQKGDEAVAALKRAVLLKPDMGEAWRALGDHLTAIGDNPAADDAYARYLRFSSQDPRLLQAGAALVENRLPEAETLLRQHLKQHPTDVAAIRMLAEVAARLGRNGDAETLLARCLELAPSFHAARLNYAMILHRRERAVAALAETERLLAISPRNIAYRSLKAAILGRIGEYAQAIELYSELIREYPNNAKAWMNYGHALRTAGRVDETVAAYRRSIEINPGLGEVYWSLANLKTYRFAEAEIGAMRAQLTRTDLTDEDRYHFHFALGKALEDRGGYPGSFEHYAQGNALRKRSLGYTPERTAKIVRINKELFTAAFFAERKDWGTREPDPIFIVGLPRAGSTLLEQILASHPQVEGTMELPDIITISRSLDTNAGPATDAASRYQAVLATLDAQELRKLGASYLATTRIQRKSGAPFFIDKMPNNWAHTALIHLILPNAKIIDARRHPLGCCFSNFKQHFARGQHFTYSLEDIGRYYRSYVELMAHFDAVLPGRIHRVIYETMVTDTEQEVRRLLDYCGLPFDERCLRFYENERAVRTASSEQVRQPIYRDSVEHWKHYEPWLGPLKDALGPVLEAYPEVPQF